MNDVIIAPIYLIVAYGVFWLFSFLLILSIRLRQRRLEKEIRALEAYLEKE